MVDNFVVANYAKELVSGGYKQAEVDAHFAFIQERIKFWAEKERKGDTQSLLEGR